MSRIIPDRTQRRWRPLIVRAALLVLVLAGLGLLIYYAFLQKLPELWPLLRSGDDRAIATYLGSQNPLSGIVSTALLAFLQPISIVLPGAPIQIAAGVVYGTLQGFLICHAAYVASNIVVFFFARVLGERLDRHLARFAHKLDFLKGTPHPAYMTAMACLVPLLPNGLVPYAAARTRMKLQEFVLAVILGSFFPILIMCAIGKQILEGDYAYAACLLIGDLLVVIVLTIFRERVCRRMSILGERLLRLLHLADPSQEK